MNRKFLNYAIFIAVVAIVVGFAVRHSRHMAYLVDSMAGPDREKRVAAAKELVKGEQFMDAITGETVSRKIRIVQALEDWAEKDAVAQAVAFLKDPDKPVRDRIVLALVRIGTKSEDNLQAVVNGSKDGDTYVRKSCIAVLQILGQTDRTKAARLLERALPDLPERVREDALSRRNPKVAATLMKKIVDLMKVDPAAREPGGVILGALQDSREESVRLLMPLLSEADDGVCSGAAAALGKVGSPTPVPKLIEIMHKRSAQVRRIAIGALALIASQDCEQALTEAIRNPDDDNEARAQAAVGLGRIGTRTAVATLIQALHDKDLKVRIAAVDALAVGGTADLPAMFAALRDPDPEVRMRVAEALGRIATAAANGALIAALDDKNVEVREAAARALGFPGNAQAVPALAARLSDQNGRVASACADALAEIGLAARPALVSALSGENRVAYLAATALAKQGAEAVEPVVQAAKAAPRAGKWATFALANNRSQAALDGLKELAMAGDPATREAASTALRRLSLR